MCLTIPGRIRRCNHQKSRREDHVRIDQVRDKTLRSIIEQHVEWDFVNMNPKLIKSNLHNWIWTWRMRFIIVFARSRMDQNSDLMIITWHNNTPYKVWTLKYFHNCSTRHSFNHTIKSTINSSRSCPETTTQQRTSITHYPGSNIYWMNHWTIIQHTLRH